MHVLASESCWLALVGANPWRQLRLRKGIFAWRWRMGHSARLLVLMTTGFMRDEDETRARELGIRSNVLKPATVDELPSVLERMLTDPVKLH